MDNNILLDVKNLHASINDKEILKGINLTIRKGEVHAVMGPNVQSPLFSVDLRKVGVWCVIY